MSDRSNSRTVATDDSCTVCGTCQEHSGTSAGICASAGMLVWYFLLYRSTSDWCNLSEKLKTNCKSFRILPVGWSVKTILCKFQVVALLKILKYNINYSFGYYIAVRQISKGSQAQIPTMLTKGVLFWLNCNWKSSNRTFVIRHFINTHMISLQICIQNNNQKWEFWFWYSCNIITTTDF